jgi:hypothetical protein
MSFRLDVDESNNKVFIHQKNYVNISNNIIKVRNAFSEDGIYEFPYTGSIVDFTVPTSGIYKIEAWGAMGGGGTTLMAPKGAYSKSFVLLSKDERIKILVGEKGYPGKNSGNQIYCGGGGGGTFIAKYNTPLCVAGGGGSLTASSSSPIASHACGQATQLSVDFGTGQASLKMGGKGATYYWGAGSGGGFEGNGVDGPNYGKGGISFINGGARQILKTFGTNVAYGGFGGGASNYGDCGSAAGGGGYTGGSASDSTTIQGGGGGSYFEGLYNHEVSYAISGCNISIPTNPGTNGNGFALLALLKDTSSGTVNKCATCLCYKGHALWVFFVTIMSQ